jgi:hypothetical protein
MQLAFISGGFALGWAVLGALIAGVHNLRAKRNKYVNDYYKAVIQRRIVAYEDSPAEGARRQEYWCR